MSPVLVSGRVLAAGKRGTAYLLDPAHLGGIGGQLSQLSGCTPFGGAAVAGNVAYLPCTDGIRAFSVSGNTMSSVWHSTLSGSPVYASGIVYTTDNLSSVYALDASTGTTRKHINVGSLPHFASPSLSGNTLLIGTLSGVTAVRVS
jgi:outer membrane protein assembly factor BamB